MVYDCAASVSDLHKRRPGPASMAGPGCFLFSVQILAHRTGVEDEAVASKAAPMSPPLAQKVNWDFPAGRVMVCLAMNCTGLDAMTADQSQCECSRMPNVVWRTGVQLSVCVLFRSEPFNKANNTLCRWGADAPAFRRFFRPQTACFMPNHKKSGVRIRIAWPDLGFCHGIRRNADGKRGRELLW